MPLSLLLDRDGTVCARRHYLTVPEQVRLLDGVGNALHRASTSDINLYLVTNQSAVGRGLMTMDDLALVHARLLGLLSDFGVNVQATVVCPHRPLDACSCRKPNIGLLEELQRTQDISPAESVMVGDSPSDLEAALTWGCGFVAVTSELFAKPPESVPSRRLASEAIELAIDLLLSKKAVPEGR